MKALLPVFSAGTSYRYMSGRLMGGFRVVAVLATALICSFSAAAQDITLTVEPSTMQVSGTGQTFTLEVRLSDYNNLANFAIPIFYNEAVLEYQSTSKRGQVFTSESYGANCFDVSSGSKGKIQVDCAIQGSGEVTGTDGLAYEVTFQTVGVGASELVFVNMSNTRDGQVVRLGTSGSVGDLSYSAHKAVAAVVSSLPDASFMGIYDDGNSEANFRAPNGTKARLRATATGGDNGGKITTALYEQKPPGGNGATFNDPDGLVTDPALSNRYWELTSSLSGSFAVDARFSYAGLGGIDDPTALRVARRGRAASVSEAWTLVPIAQTTVDPTNQEVQILSTSTMEYGSGQYALVSDESTNPLPVELDSFTGRADGQTAVLTWQTLSEQNNHGFYVERKDGQRWNEVSDLIEGAGNSQTSFSPRGEPRLREAHLPPRPGRPRRRPRNARQASNRGGADAERLHAKERLPKSFPPAGDHRICRA